MLLLFGFLVSWSSDDRDSGRSKGKRDSSAGSDDEEDEGDDDQYSKNVRQKLGVDRETDRKRRTGKARGRGAAIGRLSRYSIVRFRTKAPLYMRDWGLCFYTGFGVFGKLPTDFDCLQYCCGDCCLC